MLSSAAAYKGSGFKICGQTCPRNGHQKQRHALKHFNYPTATATITMTTSTVHDPLSTSQLLASSELQTVPLLTTPLQPMNSEACVIPEKPKRQNLASCKDNLGHPLLRTKGSPRVWQDRPCAQMDASSTGSGLVCGKNRAPRAGNANHRQL